MFLHTVYKVIRVIGNCDRQSEFIKCSSHPLFFWNFTNCTVMLVLLLFCREKLCKICLRWLFQLEGAIVSAIVNFAVVGFTCVCSVVHPVYAEQLKV